MFHCATDDKWWYRLETTDAWQRGAVWRIADYDYGQAWTFEGYHATTCAGAMAIIRARRIRKLSFDGIHCMLVQQPKSLGCLSKIQSQVFEGKRDFAHVVFEIRCKGISIALKCGGVDADAEVVRQGYIAHMRTAKENRWCVPESIVNIDAVWICTTSFEEVTSMDLYPA